MTKLQPYNPSAATPNLNVPRNDLFLHFYATADSDGPGHKIWSKLLKGLFVAEYEAAKEGDKGAVKARHKELLAAAKDRTITDARLKGWLERIKVGGVLRGSRWGAGV